METLHSYRSPARAGGLLAACAALALSGCTLVSAFEEANSEKGLATVEIVQPVKKKLSAYESVGLKVKCESSGASAEVAQYVSLLVADLGRSGAFDRVVELSGNDAGSVALVLDLTVVEVRKVSSSDRVWKGPFAGAAVFGVSALLSEPGSEDALGAAAIVGHTNSKSTASGTTEDAIRAAADATRKFVLES